MSIFVDCSSQQILFCSFDFCPALQHNMGHRSRVTAGLHWNTQMYPPPNSDKHIYMYLQKGQRNSGSGQMCR